MKQDAPRADPDNPPDILRSRHGLAGVMAVGIVSVLLVMILWLAARGAPSAGTDPNLVPPPIVPARSTATAVPSATAMPTVFEPGSTT